MFTPNCLWIVGCQIVSVLTIRPVLLQSWNEGMWKRLHSYDKRLGGLGVTILPEASRSFNTALGVGIANVSPNYVHVYD